MAAKKASSSRLKPGHAKVSKGVVEVNLTGVEARKRKATIIPEGNYLAKVVKAQTKTFNSGRKGVEWVFELDEGKYKGARFWYNNVLLESDNTPMENTLWSFRGVLQALEPKIKIPDGALKVPLDKLVGRHVALEIIDGEYEGKVRSEINDVFHPELLGEEDEEELEDEDDELEDEEEEDDDLEDEEEEDEEDEEEDEEDEEEDDDEIDLDEDEL